MEEKKEKEEMEDRQLCPEMRLHSFDPLLHQSQCSQPYDQC